MEVELRSLLILDMVFKVHLYMGLVNLVILDTMVTMAKVDMEVGLGNLVILDTMFKVDMDMGLGNLMISDFMVTMFKVDMEVGWETW